MAATDPGRERWRVTTRARALGSQGERRERFATTSDIEIADLYTPADTAALDEDEALGRPGEFPFTRGVQPTMYRGRFWTMRQYAGFASAAQTNERFRYLLEQGQTGLSVAFDLPDADGLRLRRARRPPARSGASACPSARSTTWRSCSPTCPSIASPRR